MSHHSPDGDGVRVAVNDLPVAHTHPVRPERRHHPAISEPAVVIARDQANPLNRKLVENGAKIQVSFCPIRPLEQIARNEQTPKA